MLLIAVFVFALSLAHSKEICYGDLGCFNDEYPFSGVLQRPVAFLPENPVKIATKFTLYNKKNNNQGEVMYADNLGESFDSTLGTKFIVHGFVEHAFVAWIIEMKNAILSVDNVNVISVDWSKGDCLAFVFRFTHSNLI